MYLLGWLNLTIQPWCVGVGLVDVEPEGETSQEGTGTEEWCACPDDVV